MSFPSWFSDFTIEQCLLDEVPEYLSPSHRAKVESRRVFRVDIDRTPHDVIAGGVFSTHDDSSYFDPFRCFPRSRSISVSRRNKSGLTREIRLN